MIERKSGLDREQLSNAVMDTIHLAYADTHKQDKENNDYPNWVKYQPIKNLAQAKDPELRKQEYELIHSVLDAAKDEYADKIQKWLGKTLPSNIDVVILNGGGSQFLEPSS